MNASANPEGDPIPINGWSKSLFIWLFGLFSVVSLASLTMLPGASQDEADFASIPQAISQEGWPHIPFHADSVNIRTCIPYGFLYFGAMHVSQTVFGNNLFAARFVSWISITLTALLLCRLLRLLKFSAEQGWALAAWFLTTYAIYTASHYTHSEMLAGLITTMAFCLLATPGSPLSSARAFMIGLTASLAIEVHLVNVVLLGAMNVAVLLHEKRLRPLFFLNLGATPVLALWFLLRWHFYGGWGFIDRFRNAKKLVAGAKQDDHGGWIAQISGVFSEVHNEKAAWLYLVIWILGLALLVFWAVRRIRQHDKIRLRVAVPTLVFIGLLLGMGHYNGNYRTIIAPMVFLSCGAWFFIKFPKKGVLLVLLLTVLNVALVGKKLLESAKRTTADTEAAALLSKVDRNDPILAFESLYFVSPSHQILGLRDLDFALKKRSFDDYVKTHNVRYVLDSHYLDAAFSPEQVQSIRETMTRDFILVENVALSANCRSTYVFASAADNKKSLRLWRRAAFLHTNQAPPRQKPR